MACARLPLPFFQIEKIEQFPVTYRLQGIQVPKWIKCTGFFQQARIHHNINPVVDPSYIEDPGAYRGPTGIVFKWPFGISVVDNAG